MINPCARCGAEPVPITHKAAKQPIGFYCPKGCIMTRIFGADRERDGAAVEDWNANSPRR